LGCSAAPSRCWARCSVSDRKKSLVEKGYLEVHTRVKEGGGRGADEHDLTRLFAALEALALEDEIQRATEQARDQLPSATYYRDWSSVPRMAPRAARKLQTQRVRDRGKGAENRTIKGAENRQAKWPETATANVQIPATEEETLERRPVEETTHEEKTGLAPAARSPGQNADGPNSPGRTEQTDDVKAVPGYWDDGIRLYIEQWSAELGTTIPNNRSSTLTTSGARANCRATRSTTP
jgi:hypothetical protein